MDEPTNELTSSAEPPAPTPIERLRALGEEAFLAEWPDYLMLGIGPEHVPELIGIATDRTLNRAPEDSTAVWAPMHAWRALGQLGAEAAIEPLIGMLEPLEEDDWATEELPVVFGMIGPAAIEPLRRHLTEPTNRPYARTSAASALKE